jgi:hypothetical protein
MTLNEARKLAVTLNQEALRAYRSRWQAVEQMEMLERQTVTIGERWRKVNSLLGMAGALGLRADNDDVATNQTRERWNRLRALYLASRPEERL